MQTLGATEVRKKMSLSVENVSSAMVQILDADVFDTHEVRVEANDRFPFPRNCYCKETISGKLLLECITDFTVLHVKEEQSAAANLSAIAKSASTSPTDLVNTSNMKVLNDFKLVESASKCNPPPEPLPDEASPLSLVLDLALQTSPLLRILGGIIKFAGTQEMLAWIQIASTQPLAAVRFVLTPSYSRYASTSSWITAASHKDHWGERSTTGPTTVHIVVCRPFSSAHTAPGFAGKATLLRLSQKTRRVLVLHGIGA